jgi:hypothetical protein
MAKRRETNNPRHRENNKTSDQCNFCRIARDAWNCVKAAVANLNKIHGLITAIATILLVVVTGGLVYVASVTDSTLKAQQRAWIAPGKIEPTPINFIEKNNIYTELFFHFTNVGNEPAIKLSENIAATTIRKQDFRNNEIVKKTIREAIPRDCEKIVPDENGRAIFPKADAGIILALDTTKVTLVNNGTHYALVGGCIDYKTLGAPHSTKVCIIMESYTERGSERWRTTRCPSHNDAD